MNNAHAKRCAGDSHAVQGPKLAGFYYSHAVQSPKLAGFCYSHAVQGPKLDGFCYSHAVQGPKLAGFYYSHAVQGPKLAGFCFSHAVQAPKGARGAGQVCRLHRITHPGFATRTPCKGKMGSSREMVTRVARKDLSLT